VFGTGVGVVDKIPKIRFQLPGSVEAGAALWRWEATYERYSLPLVTILAYWAATENAIRRGSDALVHETALAPHFKRCLEESFDVTAGLTKHEIIRFRREASKADVEGPDLIRINNLRGFWCGFHDFSILSNDSLNHRRQAHRNENAPILFGVWLKAVLGLKYVSFRYATS
jgi:hypothetical protein